uniref:Uncharacterized protein n=1 Tax=Clytia hemisphaerica TaxID=252671 RepID=A0A7M5VDH3_9CNID|eukprot:TCONS_00051213-protein
MIEDIIIIMARNKSRQNFLPRETEICREIEETWSQNEKNCIRIRSYSTNGFDRSGKYFTIDLGGSGGSPYQILVYHFDNDIQALKYNLVNLEIMNKKHYKRSMLDPFTTRWFCISMEFDKEKQFVHIESGCLEKYLGRSVTIPIDAEQQSGCIERSYPRGHIIEFHIRVINTERYLETLVQARGSRDYVIDLFKFDEKNLLHFKRLTIPDNIGYLLYGRLVVASVYPLYDLRSERLYLIEKSNRNDRGILSGFDLSGNKIFEYRIQKQAKCGGLDQDFCFIEHINGSIFVIVWTDLEVSICNFTHTRMVILNSFQLPPEMKHSASFDLLRCFEKCYLCIETEKYLKISSNGVRLFDISSGQLVYNFETGFLLHMFCFNRSLEEFSVVIVDETRCRPDYFLKILKTGLFRNSETNLKQWARLACLNHFDDEYLAGNLPRCLKEYLGIL